MNVQLMDTMRTLSAFIMLLLLASCGRDSAAPEGQPAVDRNGHWLIPFEELLYYGQPPDRIQSIDDPVFESVQKGSWRPDDRMLVHQHEGIIKVYPVPILEVHEIVNDRTGDYHYAITYCPLTGSAICWNREIAGDVTEFGVSGMLFRDNLIPYDRNSGSFWSQMRMICVNGPNIETEAEPGMLFETRFEVVEAHFQDASILVDTATHICTDSICHLKSVESTSEIRTATEDGIEPGQSYFGVIERGYALLFSPDLFTPGWKVFTLGFRGRQLIVAGNAGMDIYVAFEAAGDEGAGIYALQDQFPVIMKDAGGNSYDVFGRVVGGPRQGEQHRAARGYRAMGFAWADLFERVDLFPNQ